MALAAPTAVAAGAAGAAGADPSPPPAGPQCAPGPKIPGWPDFAKKQPGRAYDLSYCADWGGSTCCGKRQTDVILRQIYHMLTIDNSECRDQWANTLCAVCDPVWGVEAPAVICPAVATRLYRECQDEFFIVDPSTQLLTPCRETDAVCVRLKEWVTDGDMMVREMGFRSADPGETRARCFDGKAPPRPARDRKAKAKGGKAAKGDAPGARIGGLSERAATAAAVGAASIVGAALLAVVYKRWRKSREAERTRAKLFEQYLQRARLQEEYDCKAKAS